MTSRQRKPLIAVVDDDALIRRSLNRLLWARGYDATTYASGYEFLHTIESTPALDLHCVVLDIQMPGLDGLEVQRRLRLLRPDLSIVFLSSRYVPRVREAALRAGALGYFTKPLYDDMDEFVRVIDAVVKVAEWDEDE
ncbi:MAG TPA: response regulator [Burkholderiales bacterium]|nr:response regulator [Burkholderiales bacterium]